MKNSCQFCAVFLLFRLIFFHILYERGRTEKWVYAQYVLLIRDKHKVLSEV